MFDALIFIQVRKSLLAYLELAGPIDSKNVSQMCFEKFVNFSWNNLLISSQFLIVRMLWDSLGELLLSKSENNPVMWCDVMWCDVMWCVVMRCVWCHVMSCDVRVMSYDVMLCQWYLTKLVGEIFLWYKYPCYVNDVSWNWSLRYFFVQMMHVIQVSQWLRFSDFQLIK